MNKDGTGEGPSPFWKAKPLELLTRAEWESLCDGCAKCCLVKLEFEDTGELCYTNLVCRYFSDCRCTCYEERTVLVPTCVRLTPENLSAVDFMPKTCAYRLLREGRELPWWHHLVSGSADTVHESRASVRGRVLSEDGVHPDDWESHIVDWIE